MNPPNKITPVIYGTITMVLISVIPVLNLINLFCCAGIIAGGYVGAYSYFKQTENSGTVMTITDGVMIGVLSGILSAVIVTGVGLLVSLFSQTNPIVEIMEVFNMIGFETPAEWSVYMEKFSDEYNRYGFSPSVTFLSLVSNMAAFTIFGALGGMICFSLLGKKRNYPA